MKPAKTVVANYSDVVIASVVADYNAGIALPDIAAKVGKTVASVRAKLASLGVYKAKTVTKGTSKKGGITKASLVSDIAVICVGDKNGLESLQAATMADLKALLAFLIAEMREAEGLDSLLSETEKGLIEPDSVETLT